MSFSVRRGPSALSAEPQAAEVPGPQAAEQHSCDTCAPRPGLQFIHGHAEAPFEKTGHANVQLCIPLFINKLGRLCSTWEQGGLGRGEGVGVEG